MSLLPPGSNLQITSRHDAEATTTPTDVYASLDRGSTSSNENRWAVELIGLNCRFGSSRVLVNFSLQVPWDQRIAILGPNGSGKTSLMRIIATLARPRAGTVIVGGLQLPENAAAVRRHVGFVAHQTFLYDDLTVRENLRFYAKLYGVPDVSTRVEQVIGPFGLYRWADARVRTLSRGVQQRAALARSILHDPAILLLDEPETGLDVAATDALQSLFYDAASRRRTVLLTSHNLGKTLDLADRVVVIAGGQVACDSLSRNTSASEVEAWVRGERLAP